MSEIRGKDFMLYLGTGGTDPGKPLCFAQDCQIHIEAEMLEATTPPDGGFRNYMPGLRQYALSFNGVADELDPVNVSIEELQGYIINNTKLYWKARNLRNPVLIYSGAVYLRSVDEASPFDNFNSFSCEAIGDGKINIAHAVPPTQTDLIYYGVQDTVDIPTDLSRSFTGNAAQDIQINYGVKPTPEVYWMAYGNTFALKTKWADYLDANNSGDIGVPGSLFQVSTMNIAGANYWLFMTVYPTGFTPPQSQLIFS